MDETGNGLYISRMPSPAPATRKRRPPQLVAYAEVRHFAPDEGMHFIVGTKVDSLLVGMNIVQHPYTARSPGRQRPPWSDHQRSTTASAAPR